MPHLTILYTPELEAETDMPALCRALADTLVRFRDADGGQPFPTGGVRVLAYPAAHAAVGDGQHDGGFAYFNLRIARGRSAEVLQAAGQALSATIRGHFAALLARRALGLTLQIDELGAAFDGKLGNLHALYAKIR